MVLATLRSRLTFANVVSMMALFVALSGGAYALSIPRHSVGSKQLKRNAVTSSKVKNHALLAGDFKPGQLPAGERGPAGDRGAEGPPGVSGLQRVLKSSSEDTTTPQTVPATCPAGKRPIGGGATHSNSGAGKVVIDQTQPSDE